jgi:glycosyltransferase involved in cell wall biosynthesis
VPRISVITPVYNGARTIARAIDSVLTQSFRDFEIIVVDDGSTDGTLAILEGYSDRIVLLQQAHKQQAIARNLAAKEAHGEYLAFLDADDSWLPDKLVRCVEVLDCERRCGLVYSNLIAIGADGTDLTIEMIPPPVAHAPSMEELLTRLWPIVPSTVVMRREVFDRIGGFSTALAGCEDIFFWLLAREQGEFRYLPEKLARFAYDTYPELLRVLRRDIEGGTQNFIPMLHQRYWHRADALATYYRQHKVSLLSRAGLLALAHGDAREARQCFLRAIRWDPIASKTYFRLIRTFLPARLAIHLSGKAARREAQDIGAPRRG